MMKVKVKSIIYNLTYIYLIFNFIIYINSGIVNLINYAYITLVILFLILLFMNNKGIITSRKILTIPFSLLVFVLMNAIFNEFGFADIFKNSIFAIIACLIFEVNIFDDDLNDEVKKNKLDIIYVITCIYLIYFLVVSYRNGTLLAYNNTFFLLSVNDKNLSGVIIFLYLCFCYNKKYKLGAMLCIIYTIFLNCRMLQVAVILFFGVEYLRNKHWFSKVLQFLNSFKSKEIFSLIILSQALIIGFSYYCTYNIPISEISDYQESLMDGSNAIRVRANVYALETIKSDEKFLLRGYDSKIKNQLGVTDIYNSRMFMGFRLVQPHSLLMNLVLRYGIIYSFVYLLYIAHLISIYWNKKTSAILLAYIFMNMVLPFLFSNDYLIFLLFSLQPLVNESNRGKEIT